MIEPTFGIIQLLVAAAFAAGFIDSIARRGALAARRGSPYHGAWPRMRSR